MPPGYAKQDPMADGGRNLIWSTARFVRRKLSDIIIVINRDPQRRATNPYSLSITRAVETVEGAATFRRMAVHFSHFI